MAKEEEAEEQPQEAAVRAAEAKSAEEREAAAEEAAPSRTLDLRSDGCGLWALLPTHWEPTADPPAPRVLHPQPPLWSDFWPVLTSS